MNKYMYDAGSADKRRLHLLNQVFNPLSQTLLLAQSLTSKKTILDVGCGHGEMTCWLANQAPQAQLIGIDKNEAALAIARTRVKQQQLNNVNFIHISVPEDLAALSTECDLITMRYVLVHLTYQQQIDTLHTLQQQLVSGGTLVCEDIVLDDGQPRSPAFQAWIDVFLKLGDKLHIDFNFGLKLPELAQTARFTVLQQHQVRGNFQQAQRDFFALDLYAVKPLLLQHQILSETDIDSLAKALEQEFEPTHCGFSNRQIVATTATPH